MKILIIEDDKLVSKLLKVSIERWGHSAIVAGTGKEALRISKNEIYDLILLDIFLPDIVAYDLIPELKQGMLDSNIITMTGYSSKEVEEKVRLQGILYYMVKPVDLVELESIIQHLSKKYEIKSQKIL